MLSFSVALVRGTIRTLSALFIMLSFLGIESGLLFMPVFDVATFKEYFYISEKIMIKLIEFRTQFSEAFSSLLKLK
jgi:hypothetical protein